MSKKPTLFDSINLSAFIYDSVWSYLDTSVRSSVSDKVYSTTDNSVLDPIWHPIFDSLRGSIRSIVINGLYIYKYVKENIK